MKKLRLAVETLRVQSFATHTTQSLGGTVRGNGYTGTADCPSQMIGCDGYKSIETLSGSACLPETQAGPSCYSRCGENEN